MFDSKQVALLMSGGVDSSVAACLLLEQGYSVYGVHLKLFTFGDVALKKAAWAKVKDVTQNLGIPCKLLDLEEVFKTQVIDPFIQSYRDGYTPNPCVVCNKTIKFGAFFDYAVKELGADFISSGHYARILPIQDSLVLAKAVDTKKDQSYFLYQLDQTILSKLILPLGSLTKPEVRELTKQFSLLTDFGKESEDVCFFPGDFKSFIPDWIMDKPGPVIDRSGKILGSHKGIHYYTIGQRQGLGIASSVPLYITNLDPIKNAVVVGSREEASARELFVQNIHWIHGSMPAPDVSLKAKVRYRGVEKTVQICKSGEGYRVTFDEPQFAITKGQSIVFYDGEYVLGGGVIDGNTNFSS